MRIAHVKRENVNDMESVMNVENITQNQNVKDLFAANVEKGVKVLFEK